jgi:hypothetical protein
MGDTRHIPNSTATSPKRRPLFFGVPARLRHPLNSAFDLTMTLAESKFNPLISQNKFLLEIREFKSGKQEGRKRAFC